MAFLMADACYHNENLSVVPDVAAFRAIYSIQQVIFELFFELNKFANNVIYYCVGIEKKMILCHSSDFLEYQFRRICRIFVFQCCQLHSLSIHDTLSFSIKQHV